MGEGLVVYRCRTIIVGNRFQRLITKPEKITAQDLELKGRRRCEMRALKKSSHADVMPQVEVKFNISVQVIVHKVIYGFVLILWLIVSAWPS